VFSRLQLLLQHLLKSEFATDDWLLVIRVHPVVSFFFFFRRSLLLNFSLPRELLCLVIVFVVRLAVGNYPGLLSFFLEQVLLSAKLNCVLGDYRSGTKQTVVFLVGRQVLVLLFDWGQFVFNIVFLVLSRGLLGEPLDGLAGLLGLLRVHLLALWLP